MEWRPLIKFINRLWHILRFGAVFSHFTNDLMEVA
jgi:hypothetical protein